MEQQFLKKKGLTQGVAAVVALLGAGMASAQTTCNTSANTITSADGICQLFDDGDSVTITDTGSVTQLLLDNTSAALATITAVNEGSIAYTLTAVTASGLGVNLDRSNGPVSYSLTNSGSISTTMTATGAYANALGIQAFSGHSTAFNQTESGTISVKSDATNGDADAGGIVNHAGGTFTGLFNAGDISVQTQSSTNNAFASGIANGGTITNLTNTGKISTRSNANDVVAYGITNDGTITNLVNSGTIQASAAATGAAFSHAIINGGTITNLINTGTLQTSATGLNTYTSDIYNRVGAVITTLDNSGTIGVIENHGSIGTYINRTELTNISSFLIGSGSLGTLQNFGTISAAAGTTEIIKADHYIQEDSGVFRTQVSDDSTYGKLAVTGEVWLMSDAKIEVDVSNPNFAFNARALDDVISAGTTLNSDGTFAVSDNSLLFDFDARLDGNTVDLALTAAPSGVEAAVNTQKNTPAKGAAQVFDTLVTGFVDDNTSGNSGMDEVIVELGKLSSEAQISAAVSQTLPTLTGATRVAALDSAKNTQGVLQGRLALRSGQASGEEYLTDEYLWLKTFASRLDQDSHQALEGFDADSYGLILGIDGDLNSKTTLGFAFSYAQTDADSHSNNAPQSLEVKSYQLSIYGDHRLDHQTKLNVQAGLGLNTNDTERYIALTDATAKADYDSFSSFVGAGVERAYTLSDKLLLTPELRLDYRRIAEDSYRESGAGALNLEVADNTAEQLIISLGGHASYQFNSASRLSLNLGVGYDTIADDANVVAAFSGANNLSFITEGLEVDSWLYSAGIGYELTTDNGTLFSLRYDAEKQHQRLQETVSLNLRKLF